MSSTTNISPIAPGVRLHLTDTPLARSLRHPVPDCRATRRYQQSLDNQLDAERRDWAVERMGREATAPLCRAAFCWYSPLSRHHRDPVLLQFFQDGFRKYVGNIDDSGLPKRFGLNGESWAHGWDIEGLIYGLHFCREALAADVLELAAARFPLAAHRLANLKRTPEIIGSYGNQRTVWTLGLYLYGQILNDPQLTALSDQFFYEALDKILDPSGQVIEQQGPCMHYSYTALTYTWLNLAVRGDHSRDSLLSKTLAWFRARHTDSFYPLAGPSTRTYNETLNGFVTDLLTAAESIAATDPLPLEWVSQAAAHADLVRSAHGGSPLIWAMLACTGDHTPTTAQREQWDAPRLDFYGHTHLLKRAPVKYMLVRQRYQTHFNLRDYLPFSGIQTWAWENEPPIIHPTPIAPSTTQGFGLDTARQGVSHNWGGYGAGAVGIDGYLKGNCLVARYDWFWRVVVFTPAATVVVEFGRGGNRRTLWTLNRVEPATPKIESGRVTFTGRAGCLHTTLKSPPELVTLPDGHAWTKNVRQLVYDCGDGMVAFALSNAEFRFTDPLHFTDASGNYELHLDPRLLTPENPGNLSIDTWKLARETKVICLTGNP
ncbi:MAG: hypothetical protein PCFJNLEI_00541 [Verrucomicrobiae bacterium]|nr:hypothetical protein [Verrucomicrobiae bacterium]